MKAKGRVFVEIFSHASLPTHGFGNLKSVIPKEDTLVWSVKQFIQLSKILLIHSWQVLQY